jgi:KUP system potassium uptake protein
MEIKVYTLAEVIPQMNKILKSTAAIVSGSVAVQALGIVYGDIGTSPLYAFREAIHFIGYSVSNVIGIISLIIWSLILVISVKYVWIILSINHNGEGGITALLSILKGKIGKKVFLIGLFGVALLYADGIITPAISVLSAVEGVSLVIPSAEEIAVPVTVMILIGLFSIQRWGTKKVGTAFGPIMILWFFLCGVFGFAQIVSYPAILTAFNPINAIYFFIQNGFMGFLTLSAVVLVVTGGEALYADLGHFGVAAIRKGWLYVAMPALLLNYMGQGAYVITNGGVPANPFFAIVPDVLKLPMILIATLAAIIASQALISGAFSLTKQLINLHYLPQVEILGTNKKQYGQIYIPIVNKFLLIGSVALVFIFGSSSALAGAYGLAVTGTMGITTFLVWLSMVRVMSWKGRLKRYKNVILTACTVPLITLDIVFLSANFSKIRQGGWIPLTISVLLTLFLRRYYVHNKKIRFQRKVPLASLMKNLDTTKPHAIIYIGNYVDFGVAASINTVVNLGLTYTLVHINVDSKRAGTIAQHLLDDFKGDPMIVDSPSGDIVAPAVETACELRNKYGSVIAVVGKPIVRGVFHNLHITSNSLEKGLVAAGISVIGIPWEVKPNVSIAV